MPEVRLVLVHRIRAEPVARTLSATAAAPVHRPIALTLTQPHAVVISVTIRRRDLLGLLGIVAGTAAPVATITVPFNDAALAIAVALVMRGGLTVLDADGGGR